MKEIFHFLFHFLYIMKAYVHCESLVFKTVLVFVRIVAFIHSWHHMMHLHLRLLHSNAKYTYSFVWYSSWRHTNDTKNSHMITELQWCTHTNDPAVRPLLKQSLQNSYPPPRWRNCWIQTGNQSLTVLTACREEKKCSFLANHITKSNS